MRTTQQFSITLPNEMADIVKAKVAAGEYATESEVIRDGLRVLMARDRALESWLRQEVGPAYDALKADPARAVTVDKLRAALAAESLLSIADRVAAAGIAPMSMEEINAEVKAARAERKQRAGGT